MRNNSGIKAKTGHSPPGKCFCLIQLILFWKFSPELKWILRTWPSPVRSLPLSLPTSTIYLSQVQCLRKSRRVHPLIHIFHLSGNKAWTERDFVQKSSVYATLARHFLPSAAEKRAGRICLGDETWAARCHGSSGAPARPQRRSPPGMASSVRSPGPRWGKGPLCSSFSSWRRSCVWAQRRFSESVSATAVYARNLRVWSIYVGLSHDDPFSQGANLVSQARVKSKSKIFFFFVISKTYVWFFFKALQMIELLGDNIASGWRSCCGQMSEHWNRWKQNMTDGMIRTLLLQWHYCKIKQSVPKILFWILKRRCIIIIIIIIIVRWLSSCLGFIWSYLISPAVAGWGAEIRGLRGLHLDSAAGCGLDLLSEDFGVTLWITATVQL